MMGYLRNFIILTSFVMVQDKFSEISNYEIKTFDVLVDHFTFVNNRTFALRYLVNNQTVADDDSPILFYTGDNVNIEIEADRNGFIFRAAAELKASIVFAEHRYYGKSLPFGNDSYIEANLGYLTTQQVLADYAELLSFLNPQGKRPVIAIGGSYGGKLAAWMRLKYPHLIIGSLASSAPLRSTEGYSRACDLYTRMVTYVFQNSLEGDNNHCVENVINFWTILK